MNYYSFHIGDYAAHTQRLSLMEDLAYRRLIDLYYLSEKPILGDAASIAREIGMLGELASVDYVLRKYFTKGEIAYSNIRCDSEIAIYNAKKQQASNAGKASAAKRSNGNPTPVENNPTPVQLTSIQEPVSSIQEPIANIKEESKSKPLSASTIPPLSAGFQKFWNEWPAGERKVGKVKASQFWKREKLEARTDEIVALVAAWKLTEKWTSGFCPQPMTWLNGRQYEDGLPHAEPPKPLNAQQQRDSRSAQLRGELPYDAKPDFLNEIDMGLIEHGTNLQ